MAGMGGPGNWAEMPGGTWGPGRVRCKPEETGSATYRFLEDGRTLGGMDSRQVTNWGNCVPQILSGGRAFPEASEP